MQWCRGKGLRRVTWRREGKELERNKSTITGGVIWTVLVLFFSRARDVWVEEIE
jgi:hypothetical protein